jgi:hypothetical protein
MLHPPESVEVWREKHNLSRIKIDLEKLWESFHTSTYILFREKGCSAALCRSALKTNPSTAMRAQPVFDFNLKEFEKSAKKKKARTVGYLTESDSTRQVCSRLKSAIRHSS